MAEYIDVRYVPIEIIDLIPEEKLPFQLYLPMPLNKRVVPLGDSLSVNVAHALRSVGKNQLVVKTSDFGAYRAYVASRYRKIGPLPLDPLQTMSALLGLDTNARAHAVQEATIALETLFSSIPDFGEGLCAILHDAKHSAAVGIYATLFAGGLGIEDLGELQDIAVAAILHDAGVALLDPNIARTPDELRSDQEQLAAENHGSLGLQFMADLGFELTERVKHIIRESDRVAHGDWPPESEPLHKLTHLLIIADLTDSTTRGWVDGKQYAPLEALQRVFAVPLRKNRHCLDPIVMEPLADWLRKCTGKRFRVPGGKTLGGRHKLSGLLRASHETSQKPGSLFERLKIFLRRIRAVVVGN